MIPRAALTAAATSALLLGAAGALAQSEQDDPRLWLDRISRALDQLNYRGTFVHITDERAETMRVIHRVENGDVTERLVFLDGSGREIVRSEEETRCILQDDRAVLVDKIAGRSPLSKALPAYNSALDDYYHFVSHGSDRIADRATRVIEVRPKDEFRYGYRLWIDEETAMPLQSVMVTAPGGQPIERLLFTEISYPETIPEDDLIPGISSEGFTYHVLDAEPRDSQTLWSAERLPQGFALSAANREPAEDSQTEEEHLVYSDGIASVSVFVERIRSDREPVSGFAALGGSNAFSTVVDGYQVTAIGEVPAPTLKLIGSSMRLRPANRR